MRSINFLTNRERNRMMQLLRMAGIKPPNKGYGIKALGGSVLRHHSANPWQVIDISEENYQYIVNRKPLTTPSQS